MWRGELTWFSGRPGNKIKIQSNECFVQSVMSSYQNPVQSMVPFLIVRFVSLASLGVSCHLMVCQYMHALVHQLLSKSYTNIYREDASCSCSSTSGLSLHRIDRIRPDAHVGLTEFVQMHMSD